MEKFPSTSENEGLMRKAGKIALAGAALFASTTAEAQQQPDSDSTHTYEISIQNEENQKIVSHLIALEERMKSLSKKVERDEKRNTYAILEKDEALGQSKLSRNLTEYEIFSDAEIHLINRENRSFDIIARDKGSIRGLLEERTVMNNYGDPKKNHVLEQYVPIDFYVVIDSKEEGDSIITTVRRINMHNKKVDLRTVVSKRIGDARVDAKNASTAVALELDSLTK